MKSIFRSGRRRPHQHREETQQENAAPFFDKTADQPRSPFFAPGGAAVQDKLAIGQPGDQYEREADAVADSVVQNQGRGATPAIQGKGISRIQRVLTAADSDAATADERMEEDKMVQEKPEVQREPAAAEAMTGEEEEPVQMQQDPLSPRLQWAMEEEEPVQMQQDPLSPRLQRAMEEEEPVQMQQDPLSPRLQRAMEEELQAKAEPGGASAAGPNLSSRIEGKAGKGSPLPGKARAEMEQSFGTDFSGVNIHTDTEAMQMNKELGAQAFTHGQDVYFNSGKFSPENTEGKRLLAHELTHVVQQGEGAIKSRLQRTIGDGHDLRSPQFANDIVLESIYDSEQIIKEGSTGGHISKIQNLLISLGYQLNQFGADGDFGKETLEAVKAFQKANGLKADGVIGPNTMEQLDLVAFGNQPIHPSPAIGPVQPVTPASPQPTQAPTSQNQGGIIGRVLSFITLKRNHIHLTGEDKYGHWWTEILTSTKDESFGWWPKYGVGLKDTIFGTEGELNGQTTFGGTPTKDPHHGDSGEEVFHPKLTVSKTDDQVVQDIESFAKNYTGEWRWTFGWGQNCHTFQKNMMEKVGLKS